MKVIGYILAVLFFLLSLLAIAWGFGWIDIFFLRTLGRAKADAEREVFEGTRSYNQGKIQELSKLKLEYDQAATADKPALAAVIRQRFADYDARNLPDGLGVWLRAIRGY